MSGRNLERNGTAHDAARVGSAADPLQAARPVAVSQSLRSIVGAVRPDATVRARVRRARVFRIARGWKVGTVRMFRVASLATLCLVLLACATPDAPGVRGRWKPVNQFAETPQAIPLHSAYVFQASPTDGTLKSMLARWAGDARLVLAYEHAYDYTLHRAASQVRTTDVREAAAQLTQAYAAQGVTVELQGNRIVVRAATADSGEVAAGGQSAASH